MSPSHPSNEAMSQKGSMSRPRAKVSRKRPIKEIMNCPEPAQPTSDTEVDDAKTNKSEETQSHRLFTIDTIVRTSPPDDNQPWLQNRKKNLETSALYKIPREVLLRILEHTDCATKQVLWCTASRFMALVSTAWDLKVRPTNPKWMPTPLTTVGRPFGVWPVSGDDDERLASRQALRTLLHRDHPGKLCTPCLEFRHNKPDHRHLDCGRGFAESTTSSWCYWCKFSHPWPCSSNETHHCIQCRVDHPQVFFAIGRRNNPGKGIRSCIGWTAKINLCPHISWAWKDVQKHLKRFTKREKGTNLLRALGKCPCAEPLSRPDGKDPAQVVEARFSEDQTAVLVTSRTRAFKPDPATPMRHEYLRAWTSSPSNQQALKGILCPHVRLGDGQLLLPFAQNQCACFDHPSSMVAEGHLSTQEHDHRMGPTSTLPGIIDPCCRCRAQSTPSRAGTFMPADVEGGSRWAAGGSCPDTTFRSTGHAYECPTCSMRYSWTRDEVGEVYLETGVSIDVTQPLPKSSDPRVKASDGETRKMWVDKWLKHADPLLWGFTECKELKHVYWCDDGDCLTSSRWTRLTQYLRDGRV